MDAQSAGPGVVAVIVHFSESGYYIGLGNLGTVFFQCAGMGRRFKTIIQVAVGFHVGVLFPAVDYVQGRAGVENALLSASASSPHIPHR